MRQTRPGEVLVLALYYEPVPNFITADVARKLAEERPVTVVASHPSYPRGRFYPGTRWWRIERSEEDGVVVWRVPTFPDQSNSIIRRTVSYLSYLLMAMIVAPFVTRAPRVVWVYQTPFTTAIAALWFKLRHRSRIVYTCADLWPESFTAAGVTRPGLLMSLLFSYRRWSNQWADAIICSTRGTLERFAAEGIPRGRLAYLPVWTQGTEDQAPAREEAGRDIVYAGNLGPAQQLETVVEAAARLEEDGVDVTFHLYGTGSQEEALKARVRGLGLKQVWFHGRVAPEDAFRHSTRAMAQIVSLRPTPLFRMTIPSKLFFACAAAAPVLYGLEGEAAELLAGSGGGVPFVADDPGSLAAAVREILARPPQERAAMRRALRAYYDEQFSRGRLLEEYRTLILQGPAPAGGAL